MGGGEREAGRRRREDRRGEDSLRRVGGGNHSRHSFKSAFTWPQLSKGRERDDAMRREQPNAEQLLLP